MTLLGKHALVTGGAQGIGWAITEALLQQGAHVTISGRDAEKLQQRVKAYGSAQLMAAAMDITDPASVVSAFEAIAEATGPVDILINNAGQAESAAVVKTDVLLWQRMLDVNLSGQFYCIQQALPAMLESGWGRIINIASTAGMKGYAYVAAYCAAKHGVIGLTRALALEMATRGITVNAVCPGYTDTAIVDEASDKIAALTGCSAEEARKKLAQTNPQQRLIQPQEVAATVLWLCDPASAAINGQSIAVAGGEVM